MASNGASYTLSVLLRLRDTLSRNLSKPIAQLRLLERQTKATLKGLTALNKVSLSRGKLKLPLTPAASSQKANQHANASALQALRLLRAETKLRQDQIRLSAAEGRMKAASAQQATRALREQVRLQHDSARLTQTRSRTSGASELHDLRSLREKIKLQREADRGGRSRGGGGASRSDRFNTAVRTGRNAAYVAERTYDTVRGFTDPAMELARARQRFQLLGYSKEEQGRGMSAVGKTVREVKGVREADVLEVLTGLSNTVGSVDEAINLLPLAAKHIANIETVYGDKVGRTEAIRQFTDSAKALELLGKDKDPGEMQRYMNIIAQATMASGGDIDPAEFRNFAKRATLAAPGLTEKGLFKFMPLIQQMGGDAAGTGLMTLYSNMVGGRIPANKLKNWEDLGLLDRSKVEFNKQGQVKRLRDGAIPIAEELGRDPLAVADKLSEKLKGSGVDTSDYDQVNRKLMSLFGDRKGAGMIAQMINYRAAMAKETKNYERTPTITEANAQIFGPGNTLGQYKDFQATEYNARAAVGAPVLKAGGTLAEQLTRLIDSARSQSNDNPIVGTAMVGILSLGKASAEAADGVGVFDKYLRNPLGGNPGSGGGSGGGAGGSGIYGTGVDVGDATIGASWTLGKIVKNFGKWGARTALGVGSTVAGAAATPTAGLAIPAAIGGFGLYEGYRAEQANRGADDASSRAFASINKLRQQSGGRLPDDIAKLIGATAFENLNRAGDLTTKQEPGLTGARDVLYNGSPYSGWFKRFDKERAADVFTKREPALQFAEAMKPFIQDVNRRVLQSQITPEAGKRTLETAGAAFPESFKLASQEIATLGEQSKSGTSSLADMFKATDRLPSSLSRLDGSIGSLIARINSVQIKMPTFSGQTFNNTTPTGNTPPAPFRPAPTFTFNKPPQSAVGSIVHNDGIVNLHKGNVVFPARLSRQRPGDWLEQASRINFSARDTSRADGGTSNKHSLPALGRVCKLHTIGNERVR